MSDTIDQIDPWMFTVPTATGQAEVVHYATWYPDDGFLEGPVSPDSVVAAVEYSRATGWSGALALKITIERLDL